MACVVLVLVLAGCSGGSGAGSADRPPRASTSPHATKSRPMDRPTHHRPRRTSRDLVSSATWSSTPEGNRLIVTPSLAGRRHARQFPDEALQQAIGAARPTPQRLTTHEHHSLLEQLRCHAYFAATKPTWDLEAWRPDVGFTRTIAAFCNP